MTPEGPLRPPEGDDWLALTEGVLDGGAALEWASRTDCGAVVGFVGNVRDRAEGREGVQAVDYEAYDEQVVARLGELAAAARRRVPGLGRIVVWHRTGRIVVGEASVVVGVSSPHRAEAFDACRFLIDTLKETLPIWKHEHWEGGSGWSPSSRPLRPVEGSTS
ncbi:MAG: molybdenum cofactor biosynthesis protein MoaE [Actinomycetota bacterium]|nr:molybdenum cofactor biosynthesis protein MoaE [Actinomycetota bacterium]